MDINKIGQQKIFDTQTSQTQSADKAKASDDKKELKSSLLAPPLTSSKNVEWSEDAQIVKEAVAIAKATPDIRSEKVARLKEMIKNGTYKMDSQKIADSMIHSSLEEAMLQGAKG